jgi:hypothetical protein
MVARPFWLRFAGGIGGMWPCFDIESSLTVVCSGRKRKARDHPGLSVSLFLLLTLRMSLVAVLICSLRVLLGTARVLLALGVIALTVMLGAGTMCLGSVVVVLGHLDVLGTRLYLIRSEPA